MAKTAPVETREGIGSDGYFDRAGRWLETDYRLGDGFRLLESIDGQNTFIGGVSTGHIHQKVSPGDWES